MGGGPNLVGVNGIVSWTISSRISRCSASWMIICVLRIGESNASILDDCHGKSLLRLFLVQCTCVWLNLCAFADVGGLLLRCGRTKGAQGITMVLGIVTRQMMAGSTPGVLHHVVHWWVLYFVCITLLKVRPLAIIFGRASLTLWISCIVAGPSMVGTLSSTLSFTLCSCSGGGVLVMYVSRWCASNLRTFMVCVFRPIVPRFV